MMTNTVQCYDKGVPGLLTETFLYSPIWVYMFGISVEQRRRQMNEFFKAFMAHAEESEGIDLYCIYVENYLVGCFFIQDLERSPLMFKLGLAWSLGAKTSYRLYHAAKYMNDLMRTTQASHALTHFVVHSQYQRRGIGTNALLNVLERIDKTVVCTTQNINNLRFYTNMGFKNISSGSYSGIPNWLLVRSNHTSV